jgi:thioredoxin family protein
MTHGKRSKTIFGWVAVTAALLFAPAARAYLSSTWYEDSTGYEEALRQQKVLHAPMLVYFRTDWCPHCRAFDQLLEDPKVRSQISPYIKVRLNPEHGKAGRRSSRSVSARWAFRHFFFRARKRRRPRASPPKGRRTGSWRSLRVRERLPAIAKDAMAPFGRSSGSGLFFRI